MLKDLQTKRGGCQAIDGVAGSGKTFLAAVYSAAIAMSSETVPAEKIIYLAQNDRTRDFYAKLVRHLTRKNADIVCLNEVLDDTQISNWKIFDELTQKTLDDSVSYLQAKIDVLKHEINALLISSSTSADNNCETILEKTDRMKTLTAQICKVKSEAAITFLKSVKALALSVDSYIMITSGTSVFAPIFATFKTRMFYRCCSHLDLAVIG